MSIRLTFKSRLWASQLLVRTRNGRNLRSDLFPSALGDGVAAFVEFDVVDEGLDGFAEETAFPDALGEDVGECGAGSHLCIQQWVEFREVAFLNRQPTFRLSSPARACGGHQKKTLRL